MIQRHVSSLGVQLKAPGTRKNVALAYSRANYKLDIIAICLLTFFRFLHDSDVFFPVKTFIYVANSCF